MTTLKYWVFVFAASLVTALNPVPHQTNEESLRSALNAVTRKQRSLNANSQAYFADMPPLNYRDTNPDRKLQRQQVGSEDIDDNDQTLAFIPSEAVGQLETIGNGYQHLNNKQFGRALMDYLQYTTDQQAAPQSMFRERERSSSSKRDKGYESGRLSDKQLARLLLDNIENNLTDDQDQLEDDEYQRTLEILSNKYRNQMDNNGPYSDDQIPLSVLLGEEEREQDQDPRYAHYPTADRRNVNARYPLFNRDYNYMAKRFPVSKRSTKASNKKVRQVTDPKVAQDLGGLFGTNPTDTDNHTHENDHDHEHEHDHQHDHEHEHDHAHDHEHDHNHTKGNNHAEHAHDHSASEAPITAIKSKNLKDVDKLNKTKERAIEVKKKSVDWSQYFGIDRRKKKAVYTGRPSTQDQDNEYFLQKYYEIMAENLNPTNKDSAEKRNKLQQMDSKLKNMKNLMIEEAVQLGSENNMNSQEVKDEIMSRLSTAYSLEKLRRALSELSSSAAAQRESEKAAEAQNNLTANHPTGSNSDKNEDKRNRNVIEEYQDLEDENCPEIEIIERRCKATEALVGDFKQVLHIPCVMFHICNSCEQEECLERFAMEVEKICEEEDIDDRFRSKEHCIRTAMILPQYSPSISRSALCEGDSCLSRYQNRYRHRYSFNRPYASSSSHHRDAYNLASSKR